MKAESIVLSDLCIVEARRTNYLAEPDSRCMSLAQWRPPVQVSSATLARMHSIFSTLVEAGLVVPFIDCARNGTILMTWHNDSVAQPYYLYIQIVPDRSVRYEVNRNRVQNGDFSWRYITDSDTQQATLIHLADYLQGNRNAA